MSGALDITRRKASVRRWGRTWRIWTIFGVRLNVRRDEDVFDLLEHGAEVRGTTWFESCGRNDPLYVANERFAHELRGRHFGSDHYGWGPRLAELERSDGGFV